MTDRDADITITGDSSLTARFLIGGVPSSLVLSWGDGMARETFATDAGEVLVDCLFPHAWIAGRERAYAESWSSSGKDMTPEQFRARYRRTYATGSEVTDLMGADDA